MYEDFKEAVILLMQHPIMRKSPLDLLEEERRQAYELIERLYDLSIDDKYTKVDNIQMARLAYYLGELAYLMHENKESVTHHFRASLHFLEMGGIDLSLNKWTELVSLKQKE